MSFPLTPRGTTGASVSRAWGAEEFTSCWLGMVLMKRPLAVCTHQLPLRVVA